ncbi:MAG: hypothetical protein QMD04_00085 [Anaerolineales bacterium]|nr:hypothetical protein [Anaerolineales bacterium]
MSKLIPAAERIVRARALIQKAREYPVPAEGGRADFSYIAHVKDFSGSDGICGFVVNHPRIRPRMLELMHFHSFIRENSWTVWTKHNPTTKSSRIKDFLRQARDLVKFIPLTAGVTAEMKAEVKKIYQEAEQADREILH